MRVEAAGFEVSIAVLARMGPLMAAPRDAGVSLIGIGWIVIRQLSSSCCVALLRRFALRCSDTFT